MISGSLWTVFLIFAAIAVIAAYYLYRMRIRRLTGSDDFVKGLLAIVEHDFEHAKKHLHAAAKNDTSNIAAFTLLGDILRQDSETEKAQHIHISLLSRAFIKPAEKARVYKSLALDSAAGKEYKKALEYINQAISIAPDQWSTEFAVNILEKLEQWENAYTLLSKINGDRTLLAYYKFEIGNGMLENDPHKARILYKEALKLDGDFIPAIIAIGDAYAVESNLKHALDWWTKIAENYPGKAYLVLDRIESAYYELGDFDRSRVLYRKILDKHPEADMVRFELAMIYEKMGEIDTALSFIRQAPKKTAPLALAEIKFAAMTNDLDSLKTLIEAELDKISARKYICSECGYISGTHFWRCPDCDSWTF